MAIVVDIENTSESDEVPPSSLMRRWISAALTPHLKDAELCVRIVDDGEMIDLNGRFRNKPYATNVLSFPADLPDVVDIPLLGDIAICAAVVNREAREQHKTSEAHWAHMLVHGCLHLLGYDHQNDSDAEEMEAMEAALLASLGFPDPYQNAVPANGSTRVQLK